MKVSVKTVINNMRMLYGEPTTTRGNGFSLYKTILGYEVFKVSSNPFAYVVFDHNNNLYYNFIRVVEDDGDIEKDIKANILTYLPKI